MSAASRDGLDPEIVARAREYEPERYLSALLAPKAASPDLLALAAFTADLARIPATVTEPMMGEIRLQWWRDRLAAPSDGPASGHPIFDQLRDVVRRHDLPPPMLVAMTEARAFDLYPDPLPDDAALDGYLSKTEAIPFELALRISGVGVSAAGRIAGAAGRAFGLARLAHDLPRKWARGHMVLPPQWVADAGTSEEKLLTRADDGGARRIVDRLLAGADAALAAVEPQIHVLSRSQRVAVLPLASTPLMAAAARAQATTGMRYSHEVSPLSRIARLAWSHLLGRFR